MKKRVLAMLLASAMVAGSLAGCGGSSDKPEASTEDGKETAEEGSAAPEWEAYDELIANIKKETDLVKREAMMHEAEDMLMDTWAVIPLYYYNDVYMQSTDVEGIYSNLFGFKYFGFATAPNNELSLQVASEPNKLDPALNSTVDGACLALLSFAGLYKYDETGALVPDLAESHEMSEDGLTYTFTMKDGLKWSDGEELNAEDVAYSWNRLVTPETGADYFYLADGIARKDDGTLDIEASEDAETNPGAWCIEAGFVTSGPMTCTEWKHNESMTYEKNPNYYNADAVSLEKVQFMLSADDTAVWNAYEDGSLQFSDTIPTDMMETAKTRDDFHKIPTLGTYYAGFNVNSELFAGKTVQQAADMRKAMNLIIDRQYIVDTIGQADQEIANTFIPTSMADGNGGEFRTNDDAYTYPVEDKVGYFDPSPEAYEANLEEARKLLEGAGYKFDENGMLSAETPINMTYLTNDSEGNVKIGESIQQDFQALGITVQVETREWSVFLDERKQGKFDFCREGWLADYDDPINMLEMWTTDSGNNDMQFGR